MFSLTFSKMLVEQRKRYIITAWDIFISSLRKQVILPTVYLYMRRFKLYQYAVTNDKVDGLFLIVIIHTNINFSAINVEALSWMIQNCHEVEKKTRSKVAPHSKGGTENSANPSRAIRWVDDD